MLPESIKLCRTCLAPGKVLISIYDEEESSNDGLGSIAEMIGNITNNFPEKSDGLPELVCIPCSSEINKFHSFKIKCIDSECTLRKILKETGDEIKFGNDVNEIGKLTAPIVFLPKEEDIRQLPSPGQLNVFNIKSEQPCCSLYEEDQKNSVVEQEDKTSRGFDQSQSFEVIVKDEPSSEDSNQSYEPEMEVEPSEACESSEASENNQSLSVQVVQKSEKEPPKIKCPNCDKLYTHLARLKRHLKTHENEELVFTCSICGKCYTRQYSLQRHMATHKSNKKENTSTNNEDKAENSEVTKEKETIAEEENPKDTELTTKPINNEFKSIEAMRQCNRCKKVLINEESLAEHKKTHAKEKPHSCDLCDKTFKFSHHLKIHLMKHKEIKPFKCEQCGQKFVRNSCLTRHLKTHGGDRPFTCEFCNKGFPYLYALKIHKLVHSEERPYACTICWMRFKFPGTLRDHKRTHTGEKPYACKLCPRKLSSKANFEIHMRTHGAQVGNAVVEQSKTHSEEVSIKVES